MNAAMTQFGVWYDGLPLVIRCIPLIALLVGIFASIMASKDRKTSAMNLKRYLLSGVSYAIPFVACGGILIAGSLALAPMVVNKGPDMEHAPEILKTTLAIGVHSFQLLVAVLAGYIAYGMADRPGLVPGFIGGAIADEMKAGFLGGIVAGLIAGWIVQQFKKLKVPTFIRPVMPILVIPAVASLIVGLIMYKVVGLPMKDIMDGLSTWLSGVNQGNKVILGLLLGAMIAFDMGGPVNKAAFFFGSAMIAKGNYAVMGACAAAICIPPIGMGLATVVARKLWSEQEREAGIAALAMGMIGITEGAIPFAAGDPLRVIPTIMIGSMVGSVIAMVTGVGDHAPHGGPIVLPVTDHKLMFVVAIVSGACTVAVIINLLKFISLRRAAAAAPAAASAPQAAARR